MPLRAVSTRFRKMGCGCLVLLLLVAIIAVRAGGGLLPQGGSAALEETEATDGRPVQEEGGQDEGKRVSGEREWKSDLALQDEGICILESYKSAGQRLVRSGYLDLLGNVWGCVVQGDGWVEICIIRAQEDGGCNVRVTRMVASEWERELT